MSRLERVSVPLRGKGYMERRNSEKAFLSNKKVRFRPLTGKRLYGTGLVKFHANSLAIEFPSPYGEKVIWNSTGKATVKGNLYRSDRFRPLTGKRLYGTINNEDGNNQYGLVIVSFRPLTGKRLYGTLARMDTKILQELIEVSVPLRGKGYMEPDRRRYINSLIKTNNWRFPSPYGEKVIWNAALKSTKPIWVYTAEFPSPYGEKVIWNDHIAIILYCSS